MIACRSEDHSPSPRVQASSSAAILPDVACELWDGSRALRVGVVVVPDEAVLQGAGAVKRKQRSVVKRSRMQGGSRGGAAISAAADAVGAEQGVAADLAEGITGQDQIYAPPALALTAEAQLAQALLAALGGWDTVMLVGVREWRGESAESVKREGAVGSKRSDVRRALLL